MAEEKERHWYVLQTYAGHENIAKMKIELRVKSFNMEDLIFNVLVPEVKVIEETKKGIKKEVMRKPYPGYLFIEMICTEASWFMVRNTERVTGFVGSSGHGALPVPMHDEEIIPILKMCGMEVERNCPYSEGDEVIITAGGFANREGKVASIDYEKGIVKVFIEAFGRQTGVELQFNEVAKK